MHQVAYVTRDIDTDPERLADAGLRLIDEEPRVQIDFAEVVHVRREIGN